MRKIKYARQLPSDNQKKYRVREYLKEVNEVMKDMVLAKKSKREILLYIQSKRDHVKKLPSTEVNRLILNSLNTLLRLKS
jgi:hypothetical protein